MDCPADIDGQECGRPLRVGEDLGAPLWCRSCGSQWTGHRLMLVVVRTTDAHVWLDAAAVAARTGVERRTLDRWVREGRIARRHGLYDARPILVLDHGDTPSAIGA